MFKPTIAKLALFLALVAVAIGPGFFGSGMALIVPVLAIFWLDGLAQAAGVPVSIGGGVDAFNLVPPTVIGYILIVVGSVISLAVPYVVASLIVENLALKRPPPPLTRTERQD